MIKSYELVGRGMPSYHYLLVEGGVGHGKEYEGGRFDFVVTYIQPQIKSLQGDFSLECFCELINIPYGGGPTLEDAFIAYKEARNNLALRDLDKTEVKKLLKR